jgi:hypothetical protein
MGLGPPDSGILFRAMDWLRNYRTVMVRLRRVLRQLHRSRRIRGDVAGGVLRSKVPEMARFAVKKWGFATDLLPFAAAFKFLFESGKFLIANALSAARGRNLHRKGGVFVGEGGRGLRFFRPFAARATNHSMSKYAPMEGNSMQRLAETNHSFRPYGTGFVGGMWTPGCVRCGGLHPGLFS